MGEMKPTPGKWSVKQLGGYENPGWGILWPDKGGAHMRRIDYQGNFTESDARLIAEAGTVFHNTGLSPVQLVEMVKELANVLSDARNELTHLIHTHNEQNSSDGSWKYDWQTVCEMDAALAKCEGVGNE